MWPFKNAKEEMLQRELDQSRTYITTNTGVVRRLEERLADARSALSMMTVKRDVFALQTETQRREIDRLKATLAGAAVRDPKTGRYGKATNV
jgi:hypothetical protein